MNRITSVVKSLIIINVIMFLGTMILPGEVRNQLALYFPLSDYFQPFQLVTHMFMHSRDSIFHLAFNMYALYLFGSALENLWGGKRFLFYYLFTGFGASLLYLFVKYLEYQNMISTMDPQMVELVLNEGGEVFMNGQNYSNPVMGNLNRMLHVPMLGASGAVFGLLAGYGLNFPNNKLSIFPLPISLEAKYFVFIYGAIELYLGLGGFNTGIAHFAHLGGALFGFLLILYWRKFGSRL